MSGTARPQAWIPGPEQRAELNRQLHATGTDTGFWDDHGRPAPWPDDIDEWRPSSSEPFTTEPGAQPF
jgi:hypothetical protein